MKNEEALLKAKEYASRILAQGSYTVREMTDKLMRHGFDDNIIAEVTEYYSELSYLDDSDYARRYIEYAMKVKKHGLDRIRYELMRRGVDENIIEDAVFELSDDGMEELKELIAVKKAGLDLSDRKQRDRLIGFLRRRGYSFDMINEALAE